ncbi:MAG: hypothetical protein P8K80_06015 [Phycisphaerales bacterium]|nr:hypothetical protein [Phycisphaerales bacterium]
MSRYRSSMVMSYALVSGFLVGAGCQSNQAGGVAESPRSQVSPLKSQLVMPGAVLIDLAGPGAWPAGELNTLNHRRNEALGADRLPLMAAVNMAEVRVWDQQWIINGRSMENYLRSTRSIQTRDLP